jgi:hypothetical protein
LQAAFVFILFLLRAFPEKMAQGVFGDVIVSFFEKVVNLLLCEVASDDFLFDGENEVFMEGGLTHRFVDLLFSVPKTCEKLADF